MLSQSFAKNFGLYGERVGCFSLITSDSEECSRVNSQVRFVPNFVYLGLAFYLHILFVVGVSADP